MSEMPTHLHPLFPVEPGAMILRDYVMDTLVSHEPNTWELKPRLAEKWEISKDKKTYTFHLRAGITFHDGHPLNSEDVKFSFDSLFDPHFRGLPWRQFFQDIERVEMVDALTVKVFSKNAAEQNFTNFATGLQIIPKHVYSDPEKAELLNRVLIGSGPYSLEQFPNEGVIILKRNANWFGFSTPEWRGYFNFTSISFRKVVDETLAIELVKSGDLDFFEIKSQTSILSRTENGPWGKTAFKIKTINSEPKDSVLLNFNLKKDFFRDKNVRLALALAYPRAEMNRRFRSDLSKLSSGPQPLQSDATSQNVKPIEFDPEKAREILSKAGWKEKSSNGLLQKKINGQWEEFKFTLLHASNELEKYWSVYKSELAKLGIELTLRKVDWPTLMKNANEGSFDTLAMGWSGVVDWQPKALWHTSSWPPFGSNFGFYKNQEVDRWIDKSMLEFDREKRLSMLRKVYELVTADIPCLFFFSDSETYYIVSQNVMRPGDTFKYDIGTDSWWSAHP